MKVSRGCWRQKGHSLTIKIYTVRSERFKVSIHRTASQTEATVSPYTFQSAWIRPRTVLWTHGRIAALKQMFMRKAFIFVCPHETLHYSLTQSILVLITISSDTWCYLKT